MVSCVGTTVERLGSEASAALSVTVFAPQYVRMGISSATRCVCVCVCVLLDRYPGSMVLIVRPGPGVVGMYSLIQTFGTVNAGFASVFAEQPPVRAAVCAPDTALCTVSAVVSRTAKQVMHVQSISQWAPACIGPYAQFNSARGLVFVAGQIGLDPPVMTLVSSTSPRLGVLGGGRWRSGGGGQRL